jgi:type VI secretion system protein ImpC
MELGSIMTIGDVPFYYYTDADGDQVALPSTERNVSESTAAHVITQNFMPVVCIRGRPEVRLGSYNSLAGTLLAGPWKPVEVAPDEGPVEAAPASPVEEELSIEEMEARAAAEAESELDALLAGFSDEPGEAATTAEVSPSTVEPAPAGDDDADLDALLSGMAAKEEQQAPPEEGDMDPDLASLLASL